MGTFFKTLYDKPSMHITVQNLENVVKPLDISGIEAALRWICYQSALGEADSVILDASRIEQIEQNIKDIVKGPLPKNVVDTLKSIREAVKKDSP